MESYGAIYICSLHMHSLLHHIAVVLSEAAERLCSACHTIMLKMPFCSAL